jgi:hypothetical protein
MGSGLNTVGTNSRVSLSDYLVPMLAKPSRLAASVVRTYSIGSGPPIHRRRNELMQSAIDLLGFIKAQMGGCC